MSILYSGVLPLSKPQGATLISEEIKDQILRSDKVVIAVGYVSQGGIEHLSRLIDDSGVQDITLVAGMYRNSGIPSSAYNAMRGLQEHWKQKDLGRVLLVDNMSYHGKLYAFWHDGKLQTTIIGSANLSIIGLDNANNRQYEISTTIEDEKENAAINKHLKDLIERCTTSIDDMGHFKIIPDRIPELKGIAGVKELSESSVTDALDRQTDTTFRIEIKAPTYANRFSTKSSDYAISNINVAYGRGRKNKNGTYSPRNWFETQITVSKSITTIPGYPIDGPFYVVTEDGYQFVCNTGGDNGKQFSAYGTDRVFGRWIKGRLIADGLLRQFDNKDQDTNGDGIVTKEMLAKDHMQSLVITKTDCKEFGRVYGTKKNGRIDRSIYVEQPLDVWTIQLSDEEADA